MVAAPYGSTLYADTVCMNADAVRKLLHAEVAKAGGEVKFAQLVGVHRHSVYAALNGNRDPGGKILAYLGMEVVKDYRRIGGGAKTYCRFQS